MSKKQKLLSKYTNASQLAVYENKYHRFIFVIGDTGSVKNDLQDDYFYSSHKLAYYFVASNSNNLLYIDETLLFGGNSEDEKILSKYCNENPRQYVLISGLNADIFTFSGNILLLTSPDYFFKITTSLRKKCSECVYCTEKLFIERGIHNYLDLPDSIFDEKIFDLPTKIATRNITYNAIVYNFQVVYYKSSTKRFFYCNLTQPGDSDSLVDIKAILYPLKSKEASIFELPKGTVVFEIDRFYAVPPTIQKPETKRIGRFVLCNLIHTVSSSITKFSNIVVLRAMPYERLVNYYQTELNFKLVTGSNKYFPTGRANHIEDSDLIPLKQNFDELVSKCDSMYSNYNTWPPSNYLTRINDILNTKKYNLRSKK